jgi:hypothetical protein
LLKKSLELFVNLKSKLNELTLWSINVQDEFLRQPKAVLQQHCQKNGWAAPKYEKLSTRVKLYGYTVTVTRPTVGRGKNKIVGGPVLCKLPQEENFESISVSTNLICKARKQRNMLGSKWPTLSILLNLHLAYLIVQVTRKWRFCAQLLILSF